MEFRRGDRAVSEVVGVVLLLGFAVAFLAFIQLNAVPAWNSEVEGDHHQTVQNDLREMRDGVFTVSSTGSTQSVSVNLGTGYPNRLILRNPPPSTGTIGSTEAESAFLDNVVVSGETGDYWDGSQVEFSTKSVEFDPNYNEFDSAPITVYENSVLYDRYDDSNVTLTDQLLVNDRSVTLVFLNGSVSETQTGDVNVEFEPLSAPSQQISVTNESGQNITLTLPTDLPQSDWEDLLKEEMDDGYVESVSVSGGQLTVELMGWKNGRKVTYNLRMAKVGLNSGQEENEHYVTTVEGNQSNINEGGSQTLTAEVRDRYNNPVSGVEVNASMAAGAGTIDGGATATKTTGSDGRASFTYESSAATTARVWTNISDPANELESALFVVEVQSSGGGGGGGGGSAPYEVRWIDPSGQTGTSSCSATSCTLNASESSSVDLTVETAPVAAGANVEYAVGDNTVGTVSPSSDTTNSSGMDSTTFQAVNNGTTAVYASSGASGDTISVTVEELNPTNSLNYRWYETTNYGNYDPDGNGYADDQDQMDEFFDTSNNGVTLMGEGEHSDRINWHSTWWDAKPGYITLDDDYGWEAFGRVYAPQSGTYTIGVDSDDASDVYVNGNLVTSFYGPHGTNCQGSEPDDSCYSSNQGTVTLSQGWHSFRARMHEQGGSDGISVGWMKPGDSSFTPIPQNRFSR